MPDSQNEAETSSGKYQFFDLLSAIVDNYEEQGNTTNMSATMRENLARLEYAVLALSQALRLMSHCIVEELPSCSRLLFLYNSRTLLIEYSV